MAHLGHLMLFEHTDFDGAHKHVIDSVPDLSAVSGGFNDLTSSIVILDGEWQFFRDANFVGLMATLPVGDYNDVTSFGIANDSLSSVRLIRSS